MEDSEQVRVVVVGGGFAGIETARKLARSNSGVHVTLISDKTYFEYYPALYKVVTGTLPTEVSIPLWMIFDKTSVEVVEDKVVEFNPTEQFVIGSSGSQYKYDYLVVAVGSQTNYFGIPGLDTLSYGFKSVHEALKLKRHLHGLFVECKENQTARTGLLTIVIVGAGPSGVELAGDLTSYVRRIARKHKLDPALVTIDLIEAAPRILPTFPERASRRATKRLKHIGVNVLPNQTLMQEDIESIKLKSGDMKTKTVIWTAGIKINDLFMSIPGATQNEKKKIIVDDYLALPAHKNIFIIGDGAGTPYTGLAQTAIHNAGYVSAVIDRKIKGKPISVYQPKKSAFVVPVGDFWAAMVLGKSAFFGVLPWIVRETIDLWYYFKLLPLNRFWYMLREGKKYRNDPEYCPPEER